MYKSITYLLTYLLSTYSVFVLRRTGKLRDWLLAANQYSLLRVSLFTPNWPGRQDCIYWVRQNQQRDSTPSRRLSSRLPTLLFSVLLARSHAWLPQWQQQITLISGLWRCYCSSDAAASRCQSSACCHFTPFKNEIFSYITKLQCWSARDHVLVLKALQGQYGMFVVLVLRLKLLALTSECL